MNNKFMCHGEYDKLINNQKKYIHVNNNNWYIYKNSLNKNKPIHYRYLKYHVMNNTIRYSIYIDYSGNSILLMPKIYIYKKYFMK